MITGRDYIIYGCIGGLITGVADFVFNKPFNAFGWMVGMILAGIIIKIFEKRENNTK